MSVFETRRLLAQRWQVEFAQEMFDAYAQDPLVGPCAGWQPHKSVEDTKAYLAAASKEENTFCLREKATGRLIGAIGLHPNKRPQDRIKSRELGYVLASTHWGKGFMCEAVQGMLRYGFESLGLDYICVRHAKENHRSRRVIEKCGFVREGISRKADIYQPTGTLSDEWCYSMTRDEYEKGKSQIPTPPAWAFVQNRFCPYFPCHKDVEESLFNCRFCYCPLYHREDCGGSYTLLKGGIKDCSACLLPHTDSDSIMEKLKP